MLLAYAATTSPLFERLTGNPLVNSLIVLLVTAIVTGLAVPFIKARMDLRYFSEQKAHEARLARQAEIIREQTAHLRQFIEVVWRLHFAMIEVSYAKASGMPADAFDRLWSAYDGKSWQCLNDIRRTISSGIHLLPNASFKRLLTFYNGLLGEDEALTVAVKKRDIDHADWVRLHTHLLNELASNIDLQIAELAKDLYLLPSAGDPLSQV